MKRIAFTIVLNGMPYIKQQMEIIPKFFDKWYIVEGATKPILDTSWCRPIHSKFYSERFLSVDGTTEFLDNINIEKIHIIRKNGLWDGKVEMCNSFSFDMQNCILMQFDVDEIWDEKVLSEVLEYAEIDLSVHGMLFPCNYYVGPNIYTDTYGCYGNYAVDWQRLWKLTKPTRWISHEPPRIHGCNLFTTQHFARERGWVFDHYAYATPEQARFKENFYGYVNALENWHKLQNNTSFPCKLRDYFHWVPDDSIVNKKTNDR